MSSTAFSGSSAGAMFGSDVQTSAAYLQRLQEFLAMQSPGRGADAGGSHKRKSPSADSEDGDPNAAIKDRRQSTDGLARPAANGNSPVQHEQQQQHSHANADSGRDRDASPPEGSAGKSKGKGSTSEKRKEQNRNAQRAFRERKEKVLRDLEDKIDGLNKVNADQQQENQNLRELVTRLQEENARLQKGRDTLSSSSGGPAAPQAEFTFALPSTSGSASASASSAAQAVAAANLAPAPASLADSDILAFLQTQPAPPAPGQQLPQLVPLDMPPAPAAGGGLDDGSWLWNSSAFGTEIPQAIPPGVTNLLERFGGAPASGAPASTAGSGSSAGSGSAGYGMTSNEYADGNSAFSSLFAALGNGSTSFANFNASDGSASTGSPRDQQRQGSSTSSSAAQSQSQRPQHHQQHRAGSSVTRASSNADADSPASAASSSASDPSPPTPSQYPLFYGLNGPNLASMLAGAGAAASSSPQQAGSPFFGVSGAGFQPAGFSPKPTPLQQQQQSNSPLSILDMMNYRDAGGALMSSTAGSGSTPDFSSYANFTSPVGDDPSSGNLLDFNDFLVASPPSTSSFAPPQQQQQQQPSLFSQHQSASGRTDSTSSSSLPTLGSLSPHDELTSPVSSTARSPGPGAGPGVGSKGVVLGDDLKYGDPLIQHCMKYDFDLDNLCQDMSMKASCKEKAQAQIAKSIETDEYALKLYNDYLRKQGVQNPTAPQGH